ncbi:sensor histidine kinase [Brevibacterium sp. GP-SGM9]|uniref:sensor histidine kinase n=1 Tax=unclassified Brevibacterium TaxID=2614124 RepID=UPI001E3C6671|nr:MULTISPECIES: histidine kinase [unclassified Brevibacterium]MDK8436670.1 histidine kinase [Brevibacterium sp. H-BE7]
MSNRESGNTAGLPAPQQWAPDRIDRARRFLAARPWILDSLLWALPVTFFAVLTATAQAERSELALVPEPIQIAIALLQTVPLALRRTRPLLSSSLIALGCLLAVVTMIGPTLGIIAVPLTVYSTTAWGTRNHGRIVLGLGLLGALFLGGWLYLISLQATIGPNPRPLEAGEYALLATVVALCAAIVLIAWLWGGAGYRRRREIEGVWERNRLLERERESETRLAADAERMRIAREMHDVIAHSLSVVIAQADGGRYAAKTDPAAAAGVLETIAHTGRDALAQTRSLLGFLRAEGEEDRPSAPLPGIADIDSLIADVRSAGLPVSVAGVGGFDRGRLPDGASLAVYRIVQEALTNVLKHAGGGARAHVELQIDGQELVTRISDNGTGLSAGFGTGRATGSGAGRAAVGTGADTVADGDDVTRGRGHGILGMQERAALYGGTLTARPIRSTGISDGSDGPSGAGRRGTGKPGFSSGAVPGSAFGSMTGFLVEARLPLSRAEVTASSAALESAPATAELDAPEPEQARTTATEETSR